MNNIEILSPAGDDQSFFAAINNGANAIYMGLQNFNARNKAANFTLENLSHFVNIAHLYNVKIYLVVNTLVNNQELADLLNLVRGAVNAKVDAFIVQDLGVAKLLSSSFKNIVLHASTQMGIHSLQGAIVAEKLGFKRIVLSREVTKQDIIEIREHTNLEIEYFVHGALCVSFSGNCYLSSLMNNESGNRGRCLQPCRLCYSSSQNSKQIKNRYLLSCNDLCLIEELKNLISYGITSFKIEGRLRRPSYVAYVTNMYSNALNNLNEKPNLEQITNFKKLFNRGEYNTGYYLNGEPNIKTINTNFQNHRGVLIGNVKSVKPFKDIYEILIQTNGYKINKNDGLKFVCNNTEQSLGVGSVTRAKFENEYIVHSKTKPKINSQVYLTVDSAWEESLLKKQKKIYFSATFTAHQNQCAELTLNVGETSVTTKTNLPLQPAQNQALIETDVLQNLQKTKDTFFELNNLSCNIQNVFMPKVVLNELRRSALSNLQQELIKNYEQKNIVPVEQTTFNFSQINVNFTPQKVICVNEFTPVEEVKKYYTNGSAIAFSPTTFTPQNIQTNLQNLMQQLGVDIVYLNLPKVLRSLDYNLLKQTLSTLNNAKIGFIANNIGHLHFALENYKVIGGAYLNVSNNLTASVLNQFNITNFVKSFESFAEGMNMGLTYVGAPDVMTFCHCPFKTNFGNEHCKNCSFTPSLKLTSQSNKNYSIRRTKLNSCTFELVNYQKINTQFQQENNVFLDLR